MSNTRIKICGITRPQDALAAAKLGVNAIGLVFYPGSRRAVDVVQAQAIVRILPPLVSVVALFVNATAAYIHDVLAAVPVDVLQFHGDEDAEFCRQFQRPYWKAVRVRSRADIEQAAADYADARALLLDAWVDGAYGGTGHCFDWRQLPASLARPWILAGGLNPDNVTQALRQTGALAVDVSGGVESAPGCKDAGKMAAFVAACAAA